MRRLLRYLPLLLVASSFAGASVVDSTVDTVLARAKGHADYRKVADAFASFLTAKDYADIAVRLMLDPNDLEELGDAGVTYKWAAINFSLDKLATLPGGGPYVVAIADDPRVLVDGESSLSLCDAAVRRGQEMLPLLEHMRNRKDWGLRCADVIRSGQKTAF